MMFVLKLTLNQNCRVDRLQSQINSFNKGWYIRTPARIFALIPQPLSQIWEKGLGDEGKF